MLQSPLPLRLLATALVLSAFGCPAADAHPHSAPPPLSYDLDIRDREVAVVVMIEVPVIELWQGSAWVGPDEAGVPAAFAAFVALLDAHVTLEIDGAVARGGEKEKFVILESPRIEGFPRPNAMLLVRIRYAVTTPPDWIRVTWNDFTGCVWEGEPAVPSLIETGLDVDLGLMSPEEPAHIWWRGARPWDWSDAAHAPWIPAAVRRSLARSALATSLAGLGGLAGVVGAVLGTPTKEPAPATPAPLPTRDEAQAIFDAVHERLYRAFDADARAGAQSALAEVVEPPLVMPLWSRLRDLMVIRRRGGVRGRLDRIETTGIDVTLPDDPAIPHFRVTWRGRIFIGADHFGHRHQRAQVAEILYVMSGEDGSWRVHDLQVIGAATFDEDEEGNLPPLDDDKGDSR